MEPLGLTNYTGSNTTICKNKIVERVQTSTAKAKSSSASIKEEYEPDALNRKEER
jgi:hypothetical protein